MPHATMPWLSYMRMINCDQLLACWMQSITVLLGAMHAVAAECESGLLFCRGRWL